MVNDNWLFMDCPTIDAILLNGRYLIYDDYVGLNNISSHLKTLFHKTYTYYVNVVYE